MLSEIVLARLSGTPKLNILLTKKDAWEPGIRRAFRFLPHQLTFGDVPSATLTDYDLVIPLTIEDVLYLDSVPHFNNAIPLPSVECVQLCDDKYRFAQVLIEQGFGDYLPKISDDLAYPYFLKKKISIGGDDSHFIENREQELALLNSVNAQEYFRQAFISGYSEFAAHVLFDGQRIVRAITLEYLFDKDGAVSGRDDKFGIKMHPNKAEHLKLFTEILNAIHYQGICCIDYKLIDGRPMLFEINPRVGGNLSPFIFSFLRSLDFKQ